MRTLLVRLAAVFMLAPGVVGCGNAPASRLSIAAQDATPEYIPDGGPRFGPSVRHVGETEPLFRIRF